MAVLDLVHVVPYLEEVLLVENWLEMVAVKIEKNNKIKK